MSVETYGFAIYISAFALSIIWIGWAFVTDDTLNYIGIIYYPSKYSIHYDINNKSLSSFHLHRYWAATIPSLVIVAYISWFFYYTLSVLIMTAPRKTLAKCTGNRMILCQ